MSWTLFSSVWSFGAELVWFRDFLGRWKTSVEILCVPPSQLVLHFTVDLVSCHITSSSTHPHVKLTALVARFDLEDVESPGVARGGLHLKNISRDAAPRGQVHVAVQNSERPFSTGGVLCRTQTLTEDTQIDRHGVIIIFSTGPMWLLWTGFKDCVTHLSLSSMYGGSHMRGSRHVYPPWKLKHTCAVVHVLLPDSHSLRSSKSNTQQLVRGQQGQHWS